MACYTEIRAILDGSCCCYCWHLCTLPLGLGFRFRFMIHLHDTAVDVHVCITLYWIQAEIHLKLPIHRCTYRSAGYMLMVMIERDAWERERAAHSIIWYLSSAEFIDSWWSLRFEDRFMAVGIVETLSTMVTLASDRSDHDGHWFARTNMDHCEAGLR